LPDAEDGEIFQQGFFGGVEQLEAMNAFLEKRKPDWGKLVRNRPDDF